MLEMILEIVFEGIIELVGHLLSGFVLSLWEGIREIFR
jgi:hypothetical protein